jgi:hypothetical protein
MHRFVKKALGPYWFQYYDITKTMRCIQKRSGKQIRSWRNHMLIHGPHTENILSKLHFKFCTDELNPSATGPIRHETGIYNFPINIISDYDHLYHADRTEVLVKNNSWGDAFGNESYHIDEWVEIVIDQISRNIKQNSIVNLLIHPITMYLCDQFKGVEKILRYVSTQQNCLYSELFASTNAVQSHGPCENYEGITR